LQHKDDRPRTFAGVEGTRGGVDLIIVDIPEYLPIPNLSCPATSIPSWNTLRQGFLDHMFDFASANVQDCGAILLFFPDDLELKAILRGYMRTYGFALFREWMGINRLRLTSSKDRSKTVSLLIIKFSNLPSSPCILCILLNIVLIWLFRLSDSASG
jgi:hypothetical protein